MAEQSLYEDADRVLTPGAFEFVLDSELKRAVRSQNFLTLVVVEASREWEGMTVTADDGTLQEVAQIIGKEIRDTDLIGHTEKGMLSLVLIDADFDHSSRVINRLVSRIEHYEFPTALRLAVGAACYPTHAVDAAVAEASGVVPSDRPMARRVRSAGEPNGSVSGIEFGWAIFNQYPIPNPITRCLTSRQLFPAAICRAKHERARAYALLSAPTDTGRSSSLSSGQAARGSGRAARRVAASPGIGLSPAK